MNKVDRQKFGPDSSPAVVEFLFLNAGVEFKGQFATWTTAEVLDLVTRLEYAVDNATVAEFVRKKYIPPVTRGEWDAEAVHRFTCALEGRERWAPNSKIHNPKKSQARIAFERDTAANNLAEYHDWLDSETLEDLLQLMTWAENRQMRETCRVAIHAKLARLEFVE